MMDASKNIPPQPRYQLLLGVGGIGSGRFFALHGEHTLGREESRAGHYLEGRDYCKLHIICHYVKALLGDGFAVWPIGKVGDDPSGRQLLAEMVAAGLDTRQVMVDTLRPTMESLCLIYPDGSGSNLTIDDSACSSLTPQEVSRAWEASAPHLAAGIALAAPEVSLAARARLLEETGRAGFFRAASFTAGEIQEAVEGGFLGKLDLLAINLEEAAALLGVTVESIPMEELARAAAELLRRGNPALQVAITAGKSGSWLWAGAIWQHSPAATTVAVRTAGAGDAYLAGLIAARVAGLTPLAAQQLASLTAGLSVTSPHTIHPGLNRDSLLDFQTRANYPVSAETLDFLKQ
jgi:ribokinase